MTATVARKFIICRCSAVMLQIVWPFRRLCGKARIVSVIGVGSVRLFGSDRFYDGRFLSRLGDLCGLVAVVGELAIISEGVLNTLTGRVKVISPNSPSQLLFFIGG